MDNYELPKGKKAKAAVLKSMLYGEMNIEDLRDTIYVVWTQDPLDLNIMVSKHGKQRLTMDKFHEMKKKLPKNACLITLYYVPKPKGYTEDENTQKITLNL